MILLSALLSTTLFAAEPNVKDIKVPEGFSVSLYAYPVPNARSLTMGPDGIVFVGNRSSGSIYALVPKGGKAEVVTIADNLKSPNGVAFKNGDLYVGEIERILKFKNILKTMRSKPQPEVWGPKFPDKAHHGWKFIAFGPDGWLYVPVGAPCNVCKEDPALFAAIHRISPDGTKRELVAQGIRNTVGFDWNPETKKLWFTDNGRDMMGDEIPADELNEVTKEKEHFGFPYCHAGDIPDPDFNEKQSCDKFTPPKFKFPAHVAALGMRFIKTNKALKGSILVAQHGSWNRTRPIGYQVVRLYRDGNNVTKSETFADGFLKADSAWGRPVDVLELADGSVLISDDMAGAVYRVSSTEQKKK